MHGNKRQFSAECFMLLLAILCISSVKGDEITLECIPEFEGNFSSQIGSAVIYDIMDETIKDGAAIFCSIDNWADVYVKLELTLLGEPPNQLIVETLGKTVLRLENSVINCCSKDIFERNQASHLIHEEVKSRQNMTGIVRYKCAGQHNLQIDLAGLELLTKNFNSPARSKKAAPTDFEISQDICVTKGRRKENPDRLGQPCHCNSGGCIEMFDGDEDLVCGRCCPDSYWKLDRNDRKHRKGVCSKCQSHSTTTKPNTWTSCMMKHTSIEKSTTTTESPTTQPTTDYPTEETVVTTKALTKETTISDAPATTLEVSTQSPVLPETTTGEETKDDEAKKTATPSGYVQPWISVLGAGGYVALIFGVGALWICCCH